MYIWYLYTMLYTVLNNATIVKKPLLDYKKYHGVVWDCAVARDCVILWDWVDYTEDIVVCRGEDEKKFSTLWVCRTLQQKDPLRGDEKPWQRKIPPWHDTGASARSAIKCSIEWVFHSHGRTSTLNKILPLDVHNKEFDLCDQGDFILPIGGIIAIKKWMQIFVPLSKWYKH